MNYDDFRAGYRNLCESFGKKFSEETCKIYFEDIGPRVDTSEWGGVVRAWRRGAETFPKIADLMRLTSAKEEEPGDPALKWLSRDCQVKECVDGLIPVFWPVKGHPIPILTTPDDARTGMGYEMSLGCPRCRRYKETIPKMHEYHGPVTLRTQEEMDARRKERIEIVGRTR